MKEFSIDSVDTDAPLSEWKPDDTQPWEVNIHVSFGGEGFQFQLCSLAWLIERLGREGCVLVGRRAICRNYSYAGLVKSVERAVEECEDKDWDTFARRLNWYMQWEFESYRE